MKQFLQSQGPLKRCKLHQTDHQVESAYNKFDGRYQLQIQQLTTSNVLHKHFHLTAQWCHVASMGWKGLRAYNIHLLEELKLNEWIKCTNFATHAGWNWHYKISPAMCASQMRWPFKFGGTVNRHNCRIWENKNPHVTCELETGSAKVNVWCGLMRDRVTGPTFFSKLTMIRDLYPTCSNCMCFPSDYLDLSSNKTWHCITTATSCRITPITRCLVKSVEQHQLPGLLDHQMKCVIWRTFCTRTKMTTVSSLMPTYRVLWLQ
jgi:hypothetical protein